MCVTCVIRTEVLGQVTIKKEILKRENQTFKYFTKQSILLDVKLEHLMLPTSLSVYIVTNARSSLVKIYIHILKRQISGTVA